MPVIVEFEPAGLLSGEDNRLKRQAHCMKVKSCAPLWAYKVTLFQGAHQSDLDPRRHITYLAWNEKGESFGPFHESFSYQQEQEFIAMIAERPPIPSPSSSSSRASSTSSGTGSSNAGKVSPSAIPVSSEPVADEDDGRPFQLVTRKRRKPSYSAGRTQPVGKTRF